MRFLKTLFLLIVLLALAGGGGLWWYAHAPLKMTATEGGAGGGAVDFTLKSGQGVRAAGKEIAAAGIAVQPEIFALIARLAGNASSLKAGSYSVEGPITPLQLLDKMARGDVTMAQVTLIEGWTFKQFRALLDKHADLEHTTTGLTDAAVLKLIADANKTEVSAAAEGLFFPDTYRFAKRTKDLDILRQAHRAMRKALAAAWEQRASGMPYRTPYEALTMASIVEKETGRASDRPTIAGVFVNRLGKGMLLQTDPTVIYGMGDKFDGNLRKRDLQTDTPWNTYTRAGLPPTPIAMPGMASLTAALNPAPTKALYFVARGDGTSEFSETLEAHNRAVNKYQRGK